MFYIKINDIFDELKEENSRLLNELSIANDLLTKFSEFRYFIALISKLFKPNLDENQIKTYHELSDEIDNSYTKFKLQSNVQIVDSNSADTQFWTNSSTIDTSDDCLTTNPSIESIESTKHKTFVVKKRSSPMICDFIGCGKRFSNLSNLRRHKRRHHGVSDKSYAKSLEKIDSNPTVIQSPICDNSSTDGTLVDCPTDALATDSNIQANYITNTKNSMTKKRSSPLVCSFIGCGKRFSTLSNLRKHRKTHTTESQPISCHFEGCSYVTSRVWLMKEHLIKHSDYTYTCDECPKRFKTSKRLERHVSLVHRLLASALVCGVNGCQRQFKTEASFAVHRKIYHTNKLIYQCHYPGCDFKAHCQTKINIHLIKHSDEKPFACTVPGCTARWKYKQMLDKHITTVHLIGPRLNCPIDGCDKTFKNGDLRNRHILLYHTGKIMSCEWPGCEYQTRNSTRLKEHTASHSDTPFVCDWPQCETRFTRKDCLMRHMKAHVYGPRPRKGQGKHKIDNQANQ